MKSKTFYYYKNHLLSSMALKLLNIRWNRTGSQKNHLQHRITDIFPRKLEFLSLRKAVYNNYYQLS